VRPGEFNLPATASFESRVLTNCTREHRVLAKFPQLSFPDPAWRGWLLRDGRLVSPEGWEVTTGDVLSLPLLRAQIATYQAKERRILAMDAQPEPGASPAIRA
jgi:Phage protein